MKFITNLPGKLKLFFGFLCGLTIALGLFWLLLLTLGSWLETHYANKPNLSMDLGTVTLRAAPASLVLQSSSDKAGAVKLDKVRAHLLVDVINGDQKLVSAVRWSVYPAIIAGLIFAWLIFGALRRLCANIERGEVFSDGNLRLVRRVGVLLIVYGIVSGVIATGASWFVGHQLCGHYGLVGLGNAVGLPPRFGELQFSMTTLWFSYPGGFVTGCLLLVMAEVFRQGLALKTETDLTV